MSKYIKLEDAIEAYNQAVTLLVESEMEEFNLGDFTECSFNTTQIKLIARMIESLPIIEVSEDAISREWIYDALLEYGFTAPDMTVTELIEDAPSVIPKPKEGEWTPCTKEGLPLTELGRREGQKWYGYKCSKCNFIYKGNALTESPFCQNCGAKMKGSGR